MKIRILYKCFPDALKGSVRGFTSTRGKSYIIMIDSDLGDPERKKTLKHELSHILLGHFEDQDRSVDELEREAIDHAEAMTDDELDQLLRYAV